MKLKWRVGTAPEGRYRSFQHRSWPHAEWPDGQHAAFLTCEDSYTPAYARGEVSHEQLIVWVSCYDAGTVSFANRRLKGRPANIKEAKNLVTKFFNVYPDRRPEQYRKTGDLND